MELYEIIESEFSELAEKFSLHIKAVSNYETVLYSNDFIISFVSHASEFEVSYIEITKNGRMIEYYNFGSYIAFITSSEVREKVNSLSIDGIKKTVKICQMTINNNAQDIFINKMAWLNGYENFILYDAPRDITDFKLTIERYIPLIM